VKNVMCSNSVPCSETPAACIDTSCDSGTSMLETYYSNFSPRPVICAKVPEVQEESILTPRPTTAVPRFNMPLSRDVRVAVAKITSHNDVTSATFGHVTSFFLDLGATNIES